MKAYVYSGEISIPERDTSYIIQYDTIAKGFNKDFNFNNDFPDFENVSQ